MGVPIVDAATGKIGGVLNLILAWRLEKMKDYRINSMIVIVGCIASILGCFLVISYYSPYVFVIHGQIDSLIINGAFLFAENATVSVGIGPFISLVASVISSSTYLTLQWKMKREQ